MTSAEGETVYLMIRAFCGLVKNYSVTHNIFSEFEEANVFLHIFDNIRPGQRQAVEQVIRNAKGTPIDFPEKPDAVGFRSKKPRTHQDIKLIWAHANSASPDLKLRTTEELDV